jgi:hypothetical protein
VFGVSTLPGKPCTSAILQIDESIRHKWWKNIIELNQTSVLCSVSKPLISGELSDLVFYCPPQTHVVSSGITVFTEM